MFYLNLCEVGAMTLLLAVVLATLHLEDDDLVALYQGVDNLYYYFGALYGRSTHSHCTVVVDEQHPVKLNSLAGFCILHVVDEELLAFLSLELLTVNFYNCVHYIICKNGFLREASAHAAALIQASTD